MTLPDLAIYEGVDKLGLAVDLQGWHSYHPIFAELVEKVRPQVMIEVGSWKGASALHLLDCADATHGLPARSIFGPHLYCVDTWLGSPEIWGNSNLAAANPRRHGYPQVYYQFLANVVAHGRQTRITPVVATSRLGASALRQANVAAELIYIDASHDYLDVKFDLQFYWPLLAPGGVMFGDDYTSFPGVRVAVEEFARELKLEAEVVDDIFWVIEKPAEAPAHG
jgi:hypothetical protein